MVSFIHLPQEIIEKIFFYCDYNSFINLCMTCKKMKQIYHSYQLKKLPLFLCIAKIKIEYQDISTTYNDDSDNEIELYVSNTSRCKMKFLITRNSSNIKHFFLKYTYNNISQLLNNRSKVKSICYYYKQINYDDEILLHKLNNFKICQLNYNNNDDNTTHNIKTHNNMPPHKLINYITYRNFIKKNFFKNLELFIKNTSNKINYIKTFIGDNKLDNIFIMNKIVVKEYQSFSNPFHITQLSIHHSTIDSNVMINNNQKTIRKIEKQFQQKYPFIHDYITHTFSKNIVFDKIF